MQRLLELHAVQGVPEMCFGVPDCAHVLRNQVIGPGEDPQELGQGGTLHGCNECHWVQLVGCFGNVPHPKILPAEKLGENYGDQSG